MTERKTASKAKQTVAQVLNQAKESLKILETLERETLAKARSFVRIPSATERKRMRNERFLTGLKKLGVATQGELEALQLKVQKLESSLREDNGSTKSKRMKKSNGTVHPVRTS